MKIFTGIVLGLFSGFLLYMMLALLVIDTSNPDTINPLLAISVFFFGWITSTLLLIRGAQTASKVVMRGFLLGAAEWLVMIFVGLIYSGKAAVNTSALAGDNSAASAGAIIGGGIASIMLGGFSFFMVLVCLAGFAIVYFMKREMKTESEGMERSMHLNSQPQTPWFCQSCGHPNQMSFKHCTECGANLPFGVAALQAEIAQPPIAK